MKQETVIYNSSKYKREMKIFFSVALVPLQTHKKCLQMSRDWRLLKWKMKCHLYTWEGITQYHIKNASFSES